MNEEKKEAIAKLKHYTNITAYWKQKEFTNSEIDNYIKITLNYIAELQKENREYEYTIAEMVQTREDNFIPKYKIKELKEKIHQELDNNGITRAYQITIDKYFDELLEDNK